MADLVWRPSLINHRRGTFILEGYSSTYTISPGDGALKEANPTQAGHTYREDGIFRAIALNTATNAILASTQVAVYPRVDPDVEITQYTWEPLSPPSPLYRYRGNAHLRIRNTDPDLLESYTVDWGRDDMLLPREQTVWGSPDLVVYGDIAEGTYTATVTNNTSGTSVQIDYTIEPEAEVIFTGGGNSGMTVTAELTGLVARREDENTEAFTVTIDWGDGQGWTEWAPPAIGDTDSHTYTEPGTYEVWVDHLYNGSGLSIKHQLTIPIT